MYSMRVTETTPLVDAPRHAAPTPRNALMRVLQLLGMVAAAALLVNGLTMWASQQARPIIATTSNGIKQVFCGITDNDAGYVRLPNKKNDHYFYWYFASRSRPESDPLVLWLTGGPGCSSLLAMLTENGPCHVYPDLSTQLNPYSWTNEANVIWLDQPTNVGFSYGVKDDEDSREAEVGENIYYFMQGFFETHPWLRDREFFITGESYGGHYVPAAAHFIWMQNRQNASSPRINLKGIAIGNGLTDPPVQWPHHIDMVQNAYNVTLVNDTQFAAMKAAAPKCGQQLAECQHNSSACFNGYLYCASTLLMPLLDSQRNPYDIRMPCDEADPTQCYDMEYVAKYLDSDNIRRYLHVDRKRVQGWQECNFRVNLAFAMAGDPVISFSSYVADLLNDDIRVLIYAGDADLMCNWYGNLAWTKLLAWKDSIAYNAAEEHAFLTDDGLQGGVVRASPENRLTFFRVFNAGHMVPMDQPQVALAMITRFLQNRPL